MQKKIKELITSEKQSLIDFRRDLHKHPELPFEEVRTTGKVAEVLEQLGIPFRKTEPTGIIADIKGGKPGKTVLLRADMDALPVQELNNHEYKSTIDGKMHACGHDSHTSMLLHAAKALNAIKDDLKGNIRLIFQPAEEIAAGAKKMVAQGAVEGCDAAFGIHIWSGIKTNNISATVGPSFAGADMFTVKFKGKGGHGAMPHETIDAVMIASNFAVNLQTIVSREIDPIDPCVVTIGRMEVGTRFNVIAENAVLDGTVRTFDSKVRDRIQKLIEQHAHKTAEIFGGTAEVEYTIGTIPVINDANLSNLVKEIVDSEFGADKWEITRPTMGGEDFSYYAENIPGVFVLVGAANEAKDTCWAHHHGKFNIDEDALTTGAELYCQFAIKYLNS